jgi:predicted RNA-binding protein with PUA-like domain
MGQADAENAKSEGQDKAESKDGSEQGNSAGPRFWLMKAEPTSRIENGHDVKFSIDDLKRLGSDCWDGVRNAEASKSMRVRMKLNDKVLFYHRYRQQTDVPSLTQAMPVHRQA